jgi:hypothetical protein
MDEIGLNSHRKNVHTSQVNQRRRHIVVVSSENDDLQHFARESERKNRQTAQLINNSSQAPYSNNKQ